MSWWGGIPLHRAIIVRHSPSGHGGRAGGKDSGALPMSAAPRALDYAGRGGVYADKSDIDRAPTALDGMLMSADRARNGVDAEDRLDYISREGAYEGKGAERQVDASLWDERGPVSKDWALREMRAAGGAFMDSFISVDRRYADRLGLATKEEMQRLVRATWSKGVERWDLIKDPSDIRWVAAYHTDADKSVHAHIYTWSARGEIEPGATVGREATRAGKEEVYRVGYAKVREERNERSNYLRDLSRVELRTQVGRPAPGRDMERLLKKAEALGYPERPSRSPDLGPDAARRVESLLGRMEAELASGRGFLSRNWEAQGIARDVVREVERSSPSFARIAEGIRQCEEAKLDLKGLTERGFANERRQAAREGREEFLKRCASSLVRSGSESSSRDHARTHGGRPGAPRRAAPRASAEREVESAARSLRAEVAKCGARGWRSASPAAREAAKEYARAVMKTGEGRAAVDGAAARIAFARGIAPGEARRLAASKVERSIAVKAVAMEASGAGRVRTPAMRIDLGAMISAAISAASSSQARAGRGTHREKPRRGRGESRDGR